MPPHATPISKPDALEKLHARIQALREIRALLKIPWGVDSDRV